MTERLRPSSPDRMRKPETLGEFLEIRAQEQGLSIESLAVASKLNPSTIERAFDDGRSRASTIFRIFTSLNLSPDEATKALLRFRPQNRFWFIRKD